MFGRDNRRSEDWVGAYNFRIELQGLEVGRFKGVSGIGIDIEPIEYRAGTDRNTRKRPGRAKYSNITLKRGVMTDNNNALWQWFKGVLDGKTERRSGSIVLCNDAMDEVARYEFFEAWPCKWKGWELEGQGNNALVEELEIVAEEVRRSTGSFSDLG